MDYALFTTTTVKPFYHLQKDRRLVNMKVSLPFEINDTNNLQFQIPFQDFENFYISLHRQNEHVEKKYSLK